jgi:hypothetical protein
MKMKSLLFFALASLGLTASTMAQNLPNYVPSNGLVGWWPFSGNANDLSGNLNNGTVSGATLTTDRFGNTNSAYDFSASNDFIEVPTTNGTFNSQTYSYSFWIKNNTLTDYQAYISRLSTSSGGANVYDNFCIFGNEVNLNYQGTNGIMYSNANDGQGPDIFGNVWKHIVVTVESDSIRSYLNGLLVKKEAFVIGINFNNNYSIRFGRSTHTYWADYSGFLDDIAIYNRAITPTEVSALFEANNCFNNTTITPQTNSLSIGNTAIFTASTSDPNPSYVWQSNLGQGYQTLFAIENYSGTNTSTLNIINVQLSEHLQPIRVITTSGECVDTSDIATISILDTCVTSINDTTFITVTDTLVINTLITGINPPNNSNTIKVYPNPANSHITIDYGDFAIMNGYQLRIENSIGQEVFQTSITQESDYLNLNSWGGNGLYFVHIIDPQGNTIDIRKIVLQ